VTGGDHHQEAMDWMDQAVKSLGWDEDLSITDMIAMAQVNATLALAEAIDRRTS
jgi:hypothetical protein